MDILIDNDEILDLVIEQLKNYPIESKKIIKVFFLNLYLDLKATRIFPFNEF